MASTLERLQFAVHERLRGHRDLAGLEIFRGRGSDLARELDLWARGAVAIGIVVLPPIPVRLRRGCPRHCDLLAELRVRVVEDIATNHTPRRALEVAECVHRILSGMPLPEGEMGHALLPRTDQPWEMRENFPEDTRLEIGLRFETQIFLQPSPEEEISQ
jgi:hypothetical protein